MVQCEGDEGDIPETRTRVGHRAVCAVVQRQAKLRRPVSRRVKWFPSRARHTQESDTLRPALVYARVGREGELAEDVEDPLFCSSQSERPDVYR